MNRSAKRAQLAAAICIFITSSALTSCGDNKGRVPAQPDPTSNIKNPDPQLVSAVVKTNADMAFAIYQDSHTTAQRLQSAVAALLRDPSAETLASAKQAWLAAREPYGQSEVYRFRSSPIDTVKEDGSLGEDGDGPEGRINAWPLGEALIDYVAPRIDGVAGPEVADSTRSINSNIIADTEQFPNINQDVLKANQELGGDERNVTSGYHAVEFLLWGQDTNADGSASGGRDATAGQRPWSDYNTAPGQCTSGSAASPEVICQRRAAYLKAAVDLLVEDLGRVASAWNPEKPDSYYASYIEGAQRSLAAMIESMGRLSFGELAGERMNIALLDDSQEDEHSCFSDNTHRDILLNFEGIANTFEGSYTRVDGTTVSGPGVDDLLISMGQNDIEQSVRRALAKTREKIAHIDQLAKEGTPFDQQIQKDEGRSTIASAISALSAQTRAIEEVAKALKLEVDDLRQDTEQQL